jgi:hypothetical protein
VWGLNVATTIGEFPVNARKLVKEQFVLRVRVKGIKTLQVRFWLAKKVIKLAAWVAGCGIEIES